MFTFFEVNDIKLVKLKKLTKKPTQSQQNNVNVTIGNKIYNLRMETDNKRDKVFCL